MAHRPAPGHGMAHRRRDQATAAAISGHRKRGGPMAGDRWGRRGGDGQMRDGVESKMKGRRCVADSLVHRGVGRSFPKTSEQVGSNLIMPIRTVCCKMWVRAIMSLIFSTNRISWSASCGEILNICEFKFHLSKVYLRFKKNYSSILFRLQGFN
jgi:hypothetical protein